MAKLTSEQRAEILRMRASGMKLKAIAAHFGVTYQHVQQWVAQHNTPDGKPIRPQALTAEQLHWLWSKLSVGKPVRGWTQKHVRAIVEKQFGIIPNIRQHRGVLREMGVKMGAPPENVRSKEFNEYVSSPVAAAIREREKAYEAELRARDPIKPKTRRGRPPKVKPDAPAEAAELADHDGFDDGLQDIAALEASVKATEASLGKGFVYRAPWMPPVQKGPIFNVGYQPYAGGSGKSSKHKKKKRR